MSDESQPRSRRPTTILRRPPEDSTDLYPGLSVCDDRVTGSINVRQTRLPLWAFIGTAITDGWESAEDGWEIQETGLTSQEISRGLLAEERVATAPGDTFGVVSEGMVRLSLASSDDDVTAGTEAIVRFAERHAPVGALRP